MPPNALNLSVYSCVFASAQLTKKLPKKLVKGWSVYQGAVADVKALSLAFPLAQAVKEAPMRDRHWRALAAACHLHFDGTEGRKPPPFPHAQLGALLDFHVRQPLFSGGWVVAHYSSAQRYTL